MDSDSKNGDNFETDLLSKSTISNGFAIKLRSGKVNLDPDFRDPQSDPSAAWESTPYSYPVHMYANPVGNQVQVVV